MDGRSRSLLPVPAVLAGRAHHALASDQGRPQEDEAAAAEDADRGDGQELRRGLVAGPSSFFPSCRRCGQPFLLLVRGEGWATLSTSYGYLFFWDDYLLFKVFPPGHIVNKKEKNPVLVESKGKKVIGAIIIFFLDEEMLSYHLLHIYHSRAP